MIQPTMHDTHYSIQARVTRPDIGTTDRYNQQPKCLEKLTYKK